MSLRTRPMFRLVPLAFALISLLVASRAPQAATVRAGKLVETAAGDTLHDDLYVSGSNIHLRGVVDGDVVAAGGTVVIDGVVNGSVLAAGGDLTVSARVRETVRAAGGNLLFTGPIGRDAVLAGGDVTLGQGATVGRDVLAGCGRLTLDERVERGVRAGVGQLRLLDRASIGGDLTYSSDNQAERAPGAVVAGEVRHIHPDEKAGQRGMTMMIVMYLFRWARLMVGMFILGLMLVLTFREFSRNLVQTLSAAPWPSAGLGLVLLIGVPMAAMVLGAIGIAIGGWWIALLVMAGWAAGLALGFVTTALVVGQWVAARLAKTSVSLVMSLVIGLVILGLVTVIPLLGWVVACVAMLFGFGAVIVTAFRTLRAAPAPATAPTAPVIP